MDTIVQWATILSPIIAVGIAIWTSKRSAKDTERKLEQMRESTQREVEQIRHLANLQIEALIMELDKDIAKNSAITSQANEELSEMRKCNEIHMAAFREIALKEYEAKQPERNYKYARMYLSELKNLKKRIEDIKKQVNL